MAFNLFGKTQSNTFAPTNGVEINLLPDVKFELVKTRIMRRRITVMAMIVLVVSLAVTTFLALIAFGAQGVLMSVNEGRIKEQFDKYKSYENVNQIITIQNQLSKIDTLHQAKPTSSRLFNMMVSIIDGSGGSVKISRLQYDVSSGQVNLDGQAEDGFVGLERIQKSILATQILYVPKQQPTQVDSDTASNNVSGEQTALLTDKVVIVETPSYASTSAAGSVLMFRLGFQVNSKMFDSMSEVAFIASGRKDVTDSVLVIPQNMFAPKPNSDDTTNIEEK